MVASSADALIVEAHALSRSEVMEHNYEARRKPIWKAPMISTYRVPGSPEGKADRSRHKSQHHHVSMDNFSRVAPSGASYWQGERLSPTLFITLSLVAITNHVIPFNCIGWKHHCHKWGIFASLAPSGAYIAASHVASLCICGCCHLQGMTPTLGAFLDVLSSFLSSCTWAHACTEALSGVVRLTYDIALEQLCHLVDR